jgi:hypothetical protein
MRSRLPLYLSSLSLEEILVMESELAQCKEKFRVRCTVLAVNYRLEMPDSASGTIEQNPVIFSELPRLCRRSAAAGGGALLGCFSSSALFLFPDVSGAARAVEHLIHGFSTLEGKANHGTVIRWRLGLATGDDFLAANSPRALHASSVAHRAAALADNAPQS